MHSGKSWVLLLDAKDSVYFWVCDGGGRPPDSLLISLHKLLFALLSPKRLN